MSFATVLKSEITRVANREIRAETQSLKKTAAQNRSSMAELKRRVLALERVVKQLTRNAADVAANSAPADSDITTPQVRFSASRLAAHRRRLALSANDFGRLMGVSAQSIYKWENGVVRPRAGQLQALASVRGLSKQQAKARLDASVR